MADSAAQPASPTPQNTTKRYLKKERLQELLERLFPKQTKFNIEVKIVSRLDCCARLTCRFGVDEKQPVVLHRSENSDRGEVSISSMSKVSVN